MISGASNKMKLLNASIVLLSLYVYVTAAPMKHENLQYNSHLFMFDKYSLLQGLGVNKITSLTTTSLTNKGEL